MTDTDTDDKLAPFGLEHGSIVRFRRIEGGTWEVCKVVGVEKDGSLSMHDTNGAFRAVQSEFCQVKCKGPRGGTIWEPLKVLRKARKQAVTGAAK